MTVPTTTLQVTFVSESAAYQNTLGWYNKVTGYGGILFADVEAEGRNAPLTPGVSTASFTVNTADLGNIEFFLIPDGYNANRSDADDLVGAIKVIQLSDGSWAVADVDSHGNVITEHGKTDILEGQGANALFTETSKNAGKVDYASSVAGPNQTAATLAGDTANGPTGVMAWEDLAATRNKNGTYSKPGDADYNDAVFNVSIVGGNHAPVAGGDAISVSEDAAATTISVLANDTDPDSGDTLHISATNTAGVVGTVTIASNGLSIVYTPAASFQSLRAGQTATETFTYTVADQTGATSTATVTVTIVGANDAAVIGNLTAHDVTEDSAAGTLTAAGTITVSDADQGEASFQTAVTGAAGNLGTLSLAANGAYTYSVANTAVQYLGAADTKVDSFTIATLDGTTKTVTFTIHGTDDGPVAAGDTAGVTEDVTLMASGNVLTNDTDVDLTDTHSVTAVNGSAANVGAPVSGTYGTLTLNANGGYSYALANGHSNVQALAQGQIVSDVFTYTNSDNHSGASSTTTLTINITGTNDGPMAVIDAAGVTEDVTLMASGNVLTNDTDVDLTDTHSVTAVNGSVGNVGAAITGIYGTLTLNANGSYTYALANGQANVQSLAQGQVVADVFTYTNSDNYSGTSSSTLTITVTGTDDAPIAVADTNVGDALIESGVLVGGNVLFAGDPSAAGNVLANDTDGDASDVLTVTGVAAGSAAGPVSGGVGSAVVGTFGSLTLGANGAWSYALNNADADTNALAQGETASEVFTYSTSDGHGGSSSTTLSLAVTGTNDAPVITGGTTTGHVTEDAAATANGQIVAADPDHGAQQFWTVVGGTPSGTANYHFRMDTLTITKGGGAFFADDFGDGNPPPSAPANTAAPNGYGGVGGFTESGGELHLDSNNAGAFVGVGTPDPIIGQDALLKTNIDPSSLNGLRLTSSFNVTGVFDLILPDSPREEYGIRLMDRLVGGTGTPLDQAGDDTVSLTVRQNLSGNDVVSLRLIDFQNDVTTNIQSVALVVPTGADQISLHLIHAANSQIVTASFDYLQAGTIIGSQSFTSTAPIFNNENWTRADIVADAPATNDSVLAGTYGALDIGQSGAWTYSLNNASSATQALAQGQTATDTFSVQVADQYGAISTTPVVITVTGSNDAPVMQTGLATRSLAEDSNVDPNGNLTASGLAQFSDADLTDSHTLSATLQSTTTSGGAIVSPGLAGALSTALTETLTDPSTGDGHGGYQWNFAVANSAVQYLGVGQSVTATYQIKVTDSSPSHGFTTQPITITIMGANDAPVAGPDTNSTPVVEAGTLPNSDAITVGSSTAGGNVLLNDTDPDGDFLSVSGLAAGVTESPQFGGINFGIAGTYGTMTIASNGVWSYNLDNTDPDTNALAEGQAVSDVFTYTVVDGHTGTSNQTVTVNITGTNDAPRVSTPIVLELLEGSGSRQLDLQAGISDPEGDAVQITNIRYLDNPSAPHPPGFSLNPDGHSFTIDTNDTAFNGLAMGSLPFNLNVGYDLVDTHGAVSHQTATVKLIGTDDPPTVFVSGGQALVEPGGMDAGVTHSEAHIDYGDPDGDFVVPDTTGWTQNGDGTWSKAGLYGTATWNYQYLDYELDTSNPSVIALNTGEVRYDTFALPYKENSGPLSTTTNVSFEIDGRSDMNGQSLTYKFLYPTDNPAAFSTSADGSITRSASGGTELNQITPSEVINFGNLIVGEVGANGTVDFTRNQITFNFSADWTATAGFTDAYVLRDGTSGLGLPPPGADVLASYPEPGNPFDGIKISGLPTIERVDVAVGASNVPQIRLDANDIWMDFQNLTYHAGDQFTLDITFAAASPLNVPPTNPPPVDLGATTQTIGPSITVYNGATLDLNVPYAGTVTFQGPTGTLKIDQSQSFTGTVAGLANSQEHIDLADLAAGANATLGYAANADSTGGTLTVGDGVHSANIALLGQYTAASFVAGSDGHGGTTISEPPDPNANHLTQPQA